MAERVLGVSGLRAELRSSKHEPDVWTLEVDGTPQSQVDIADPTHLGFEYVRRIGFVCDAFAPAGQPVTALHLGAGALTLPRYVDATRPGSRQQVLELEPDLIDFVRSELPLPKQSSIRVRTGDARETLGRLPAGLLGAVDFAVVDIFSGARTPAHVTSVEFYETLLPYLAPTGVVAINIADGSELQFAKRQLATLQAVWPHVAFMANTTLLKGRRFGNVVAVASAGTLPLDALQRALAGDAFPAKVVHGDELARFIASAAVVRDVDAVASPLPSRTVFLAR